MSEQTTFMGLTAGQQILAALITTVGAILVAFLSFIGGRGSVSAQLQGQLNESFKAFTDALAADLGSERAKRLKLEGEVVQMRQHIASLETLLRASGIDIPVAPPPAPIVINQGAEEPLAILAYRKNEQEKNHGPRRR